MSQRTVALTLISSVGASMCCIAPLLALVSGTSSMAARFSWLEPARPYLIVASTACLAFAWFQKLWKTKTDNCECSIVEKRSFVQSTLLLSFVTVCAVLLLTFPSYSHLLYREHKTIAVASPASNISFKQVEFRVVGMGCASCEPEVETALGKLSGVQSVKASCVKKNTVVLFDSTQTSAAVIREAINSTGFTVQAQTR